MKMHPYAVNTFTNRPPFAGRHDPATLARQSNWELAAASIGGILLGLLGFLAG